jgi:hypothetical protein
VWEVGQVRFHPAGSADALVMSAEAQMPTPAPPGWHELIEKKVTAARPPCGRRGKNGRPGSGALP